VDHRQESAFVKTSADLYAIALAASNCPTVEVGNDRQEFAAAECPTGRILISCRA